MPAPKEALTVVLPARNAGRTLPLALRSTLIATTAMDHILILVEKGDHSSINSALPFCKSPRVKLVEVPPGISFADKLNYGTGLAQTDLVSRMDADDIVLPWRFWLQKRLFRDASVQNS